MKEYQHRCKRPPFPFPCDECPRVASALARTLHEDTRERLGLLSFSLFDRSALHLFHQWAEMEDEEEEQDTCQRHFQGDGVQRQEMHNGKIRVKGGRLSHSMPVRASQRPSCIKSGTCRCANRSDISGRAWPAEAARARSPSMPRMEGTA